MTDGTKRSRSLAVWVLTPAAAALIATATDWSVHHDVLATSGEASQQQSAAADPAAKAAQRMQRRVEHATEQVDVARAQLTRLERAVQRRSAQVHRLIVAARTGTTPLAVDPLPSTNLSGPGAAAPAAQPPAAPAAPAAPASPAPSAPAPATTAAPAPAPATTPAPAPAPAPATDTTTGAS